MNQLAPTHKRKVLQAEFYGCMWTARFNALNECGKGKSKAAEKCWEKAQFWLDTYNELTGRGA
jgi:hypothetical protein